MAGLPALAELVALDEAALHECFARLRDDRVSADELVAIAVVATELRSRSLAATLVKRLGADVDRRSPEAVHAALSCLGSFPTEPLGPAPGLARLEPSRVDFGAPVPPVRLPARDRRRLLRGWLRQLVETPRHSSFGLDDVLSAEPDAVPSTGRMRSAIARHLHPGDLAMVDEAVEDLLRRGDLHPADRNVRMNRLVVLVDASLPGDPAAARLLMKWSQSDSARLSRAAVIHLADYPFREVAEHLDDLLAESDDRRMREAARSALTRLHRNGAATRSLDGTGSAPQPVDDSAPEAEATPPATSGRDGPLVGSPPAPAEDSDVRPPGADRRSTAPAARHHPWRLLIILVSATACIALVWRVLRR